MGQSTAGVARPARIERIRAFVDVLDHPVLVNDERDPVGKEASYVEDAIGLGSRLFRVAQDWVSSANLCRERPVRLEAVQTDTQHLGMSRFELGDISLIRRQLLGSTRRAGFDVERQHHRLLPSKVTEPHRMALLVR